jgi:hypothetical protein
MKKIIVLIVVLFLFVSSFVLVSGVSGPEISTTFVSQSPDPVEPGQIVTVKFKISNSGVETKKDAIFKILPKFPFKLYGDVAEKNIGKIRSYSAGSDAEIVEFDLKVDEQAVEGEANIDLEVLFNGAGMSYKNGEFTIDIQTHDAVLDITSITAEPAQIPPGETSKVSIQVKNLADSLLKDIKFKLDLSSDDLPLAPYQSSSERILAKLQSGYQNTLTFTIIADPEATPGLHKVPVTITYNDEKGNANSIADTLAISIGDTPKIVPFIKKSTVLQKSKEGILTLGLANAGTTDVKFVELFILPSEDYQLITTSDYIYLGDIDSDDTESEEINIYVNSGVKKLQFPIRLKYVDANNKPYQQQFNLELQLYSTSQLKKFGIIQTSMTGFYILILILAVGSYYFKRKKGYWLVFTKLNVWYKDRKNKKTVSKKNHVVVVKKK